MKNKNELNYQQARIVRKQSLRDVIADELIRGKGLGSAITGAIGLKTQARVKGIKAKFDPLNLVKFLTFGSRLGPALYGKLFGRSQKDVEYFTGRAKPIGRGRQKLVKDGEEGDENTGGMKTILKQILTFLQKTHEHDMTMREEENNLKESNNLADEKRHKELLKALGVKTTDEPTATPVEKEKENDGFLSGLMNSIRGIIKGITDKIVNIKKDFEKAMEAFKDFKMIKEFAQTVKKAWPALIAILEWFTKPFGAALLGITALAAFLLLMKQTKEEIEANPYAPEYKDNVYAMMLRKETSTIAEGAALNQGKALQPVNRSEIADAVMLPDSVFSDKDAREQYGMGKQGLQQWLIDNPSVKVFQRPEIVGNPIRDAKAAISRKKDAETDARRFDVKQPEKQPERIKFVDTIKNFMIELNSDPNPRDLLPKDDPQSTDRQNELWEGEKKIMMENLPWNWGPHMDELRRKLDMKYNNNNGKPVPPPIKDNIIDNTSQLMEDNLDLINQLAVNRKKVISTQPTNIASASTSTQTQSRPIPMPSVRMAENSYKNAVYSSFG